MTKYKIISCKHSKYEENHYEIWLESSKGHTFYGFVCHTPDKPVGVFWLEVCKKLIHFIEHGEGTGNRELKYYEYTTKYKNLWPKRQKLILDIKMWNSRLKVYILPESTIQN